MVSFELEELLLVTDPRVFLFVVDHLINFTELNMAFHFFVRLILWWYV